MNLTETIAAFGASAALLALAVVLDRRPYRRTGIGALRDATRTRKVDPFRGIAEPVSPSGCLFADHLGMRGIIG